jgi:hypothetical protein
MADDPRGQQEVSFRVGSVSVVICTWNRCESLRSTLESLTHVTIPAGQEWEVVVVNNNCSDGTDEVLKAFQTKLPLRTVFEPALGASRARNAGVAAASGDLLLFTDDDVELDAGWMTAYCAASDAWPDAWYFAGAIRPRFAQEVPHWLRTHQRALRGMLSLQDLGPESRPLRHDEFPWGPNMAVRHKAFAHASFDANIGRIGLGQTRGSEESLFQPLRDRGLGGMWIPAAIAYHHIPGSHATLRYFLRYYYGSGRGAARLRNPPSVGRQLLDMRYPLRRLATDWSDWPARVANVTWRLGRLVESRRRARGRVAERATGSLEGTA